MILFLTELTNFLFNGISLLTLIVMKDFSS